MRRYMKMWDARYTSQYFRYSLFNIFWKFDENKDKVIKKLIKNKLNQNNIINLKTCYTPLHQQVKEKEG